MSKIIEYIALICVILMLTSCTIPPPPYVQFAGEALPVLEADSPFNYRNARHPFTILLFCRKKYEDKTYCCV